MRTIEFKKYVASAVTLLMLLMTVPVAALGQTANTGTITGTVKDQAGAVVPGATVKATNVATGVSRTTTTSDSGTYELAQLPPAEYRVEVQAQGFARYVQEPVTVNALSRVTVDPEMKPAGATEQVTVTGETAPLVEASKTDVSGVIDQRRLESLPVNGRRPA